MISKSALQLPQIKTGISLPNLVYLLCDVIQFKVVNDLHGSMERLSQIHIDGSTVKLLHIFWLSKSTYVLEMHF